MITVRILEQSDRVKPCDWCRPLHLESMSGGHSDSYSFESMYSGLPENNTKWVRVDAIMGRCWFGKRVDELPGRYEFVRGNIPIAHQLRGHKSLA